MMMEQLERLWTVIYIFVHLIPVLRKVYLMAICSSTLTPPPSLSRKKLSESPVLASKKSRDGSNGLRKEENEIRSFQSVPEQVVVEKERFGEETPKVGKCLFDSETPGVKKLRKRPAKIIIPSIGGCGGDHGLGIGEAFFRKDEDAGMEIEVEGTGYCLASRRGTRHMMEDGYGVMTNIHGDSKQVFHIYLSSITNEIQFFPSFCLTVTNLKQNYLIFFLFKMFLFYSFVS